MKRVQFQHPTLPYLLLLPQMAIVAIFFFWPAAQAVYQSFLLEDPFGLSSEFVWFTNYQDAIFDSSTYSQSFWFTLLFSAMVTFFSLSIALALAVQADAVARGQSAYRTALMWVYAVAPPVAGAISLFLFNIHVGPLPKIFAQIGWTWEPGSSSIDAIFWVTITSVWKQVSVNFIFFLSGLQSISNSVKEAARIECKSDWRRFWTITFPLLAPTSFFLLIINVTYAFFDTFGIIDTTTRGAPGDATNTLVYKVFKDGFLGADLGGSSAQSVILMLLVMFLTFIQFRVIERRVHY